jgi:hypothetical protein
MNRRFAVPFDPEYFRRRADAGEQIAAIDAFRHALATNHWAGPESPSGPGASLEQTTVIRRALPELLRRLGVQTLLDLPCGDSSWMSTVDLGTTRYIGGDLLPELIAENSRRHARPGREFRVLDLRSSPLPAVDLVLCRDGLVHLAFADIASAVENLRASGSTWLLTTTFPDQATNEDIRSGDWRPLNLERAPFSWPAPVEVINEECTEGGGVFRDKSLALWRIAALPGASSQPGGDQAGLSIA